MKNNTLTILLALLVSVVIGGVVYGSVLKSAPVQTASAAQSDYFLKIEGVDGESVDKQHPGTIEVNSFSWGATNSGSASVGTGAGTGKVSMQDFHFVSKVSKASPKLMDALTKGQRIKSAQLFVRKAGSTQQDYYVITLENVMVSSYQSSAGGSSGDFPMESVSFNFTKIEFSYKPQKADGSLDTAIKASYDLKAAKK